MFKPFAYALTVVAVGCTETSRPDEQFAQEPLVAPIPDDACAGAPTVQHGSFRHLKSYLDALATPRHRGNDLVTTEVATSQVIRGEVSYGVADKALEDEWVQLYACRSGHWLYLGPTLTDGEGRFSLQLAGGSLLPAGMHDMFVSVFGDRTSARFLATIVPTGVRIVTADIDGTLTSSENAFPESVVLGTNVPPQPDAATALTTLQARGYAIVYLSTRGRYFTADTRTWLSSNGFPRGSLRLAAPLITLPGQDALDYKTLEMSSYGAPIGVAFGNRITDVEAAEAAGVPNAHNFVKLPEFQSEVEPALSSGEAVGVTNYSDILAMLGTL